MYRFLFSVRWLGFAAAALTVTAAMMLLGIWQGQRYEERSARNARIAEARLAAPMPLVGVLPHPSAVGYTGAAAAADREWATVAVTGR